MRPYVWAVLKHWYWFALAVVSGVGGTATVLGGFPIPQWIWWLGLGLGVVVAQFLAYCDVAGELAAARSRLRELGTREAKNAYITQCVRDADELKREVDGEEFSDEVMWQTHRHRLEADLVHWENEVRATLKRWFPIGTDRLFDSDEGLGPGPDESVYPVKGCAYVSAYIERRKTRLLQIQGDV
ncbi:MAG: hypothetical protein ABSB96_02085 [Gaiellaceae bacterium]